MSVAPELPGESLPVGQVVLLRAVDCGPPPETPSPGLAESVGWRSRLLDTLPVLLPTPAPGLPGAPVVAGPAVAGPAVAGPPVRRTRRLVATITDAEAKALVVSTARVVLEVLEGRRPVAQLRPMLTDRAVAAVQTMLRGGLLWPVRHATIGSVHVALPSHDVVEACVVFRTGQRCRALALRIGRERRRWVATAVRVG